MSLGESENEWGGDTQSQFQSRYVIFVGLSFPFAMRGSDIFKIVVVVVFAKDILNHLFNAHIRLSQSAHSLGRIDFFEDGTLGLADRTFLRRSWIEQDLKVCLRLRLFPT